ncbi:MAG TPA: LacI family DNA-binding transcriptional regulator [Bacillales bacterium]|nr:LacI family DNA-binding transcriptional regulator [Bacillales bacterium]
MKKPTMQRIADELGVSKNSVSLALSGKPGVSAELRKKVVETAETIGYPLKPNRSAAKGQMIGLIAREEVFPENTFFGIINLSIEKEIKSRNGNLLIHSVDPASEENLVMPEFLKEKKVDGLLVLSHLKHEYLQEIVALDIPVVLIDHHHPQLKVDSVLTDNQEGAYRATKHLLATGARHVGFIGQKGKSPSYLERYRGYLEAMKEARIPVNEHWVIQNLKEDEEAFMARIKSMDNLPDGWFCANDEYGFLVSRILMRLGYDIPGECSILGFDNSYFAGLSMPPLSTMSVNKDYFAKRSIIQLYRRMEERDFPH